MQICVYALFNPRFRPEIAYFYASFKARAVRAFTGAQEYRRLQYFFNPRAEITKEIQFKLIDFYRDLLIVTIIIQHMLFY